MSAPSGPYSHRNLDEEQKHRLLDICKMVEFHLKDGTAPHYCPIKTDLLSVLRNVRHHFKCKGVQLSGVYLVGGAASHVAVSSYTYTDLDILLSIATHRRLSEEDERELFGRIRNAIHEMLREMMWEAIAFRARDGSALIDKSVLVLNRNTASNDAWSLFSLHNRDGRNLELKSALRIAREYQFTTDSLRINLLPLMDQTEGGIQMLSFTGDIVEATRLLRGCLIDTTGQHQIFGGGLLKYCLLKVKNYRDNRSGTELDNLKLDMTAGFCSAWKVTSGGRGAMLGSFLKNHFEPTDVTGKQAFLRMLKLFLKLMEENVKEAVEKEMERLEKALWEQSALGFRAVGRV